MLRNGSVGVQLRAGVAYETSGIQTPYVSPLGIDGPKMNAAIGGGVKIGDHVRFDAVYSHVFLGDVTVMPEQAAIGPINPVRGNPAPPPAIPAVNGGVYRVETDIMGIGMQYVY
jgi:hypothetical protein